MFARTFAAAVVVATMLIGMAHAHEGHDHEHDAGPDAGQRAAGDDMSRTTAGPHGGLMQAVGAIQVEILVEPGGLRVFVYDGQGQPIDVGRARGVASLQIRGDSKRYRYDLFAVTGRDRSAESLAAAVDLSRIAGSQVEVDYQLVDLPGDDRRPIQFRSVATVPMTKEQLAAAAIAQQKFCPVSKQPLGSMGAPIVVELGGETVYVCCKGCIDAVRANPAKYLAGKQPLKVIPATNADAAAIDLQQVCPVMDEQLGSMGTPLKVIGLERDVYLCCKGCLKFLEKEPEKYLAKLPALPNSEKPIVVKATKEDARFVAAQKTCPVMDEPLDAMGGPWKTVVAGRVVYLCCPGCAKKLHANPEVFLEKLTSRGVTPPSVK
jgi:YHS domain-containing protein